MMQKSWFLVGVFMGWDTGFKCVNTEKWCFSCITLHPLCVIHKTTTGCKLLKPKRTFSGWKRTCRSWEVTYWVWPTSQLPMGAFFGVSLNLLRSGIWCHGKRRQSFELNKGFTVVKCDSVASWMENQEGNVRSIHPESSFVGSFQHHRHLLSQLPH